MSRLSMITNFWRNKKEYESVFTREKLMAYTRMISLMFKGKYKPKKKRNLFLGVAALAYIISPLDIVPELLLGPFGLLDDFAILLFAIRRLDKEVVNFLLWEEQQSNIIYID